MSKQNVLTLRIPDHLKADITLLADSQGVSMNHLASYLLTQGVSAMKHGDIIARYRSQKPRAEILADFDAMWQARKAMTPLPEHEIPEWDRWPEDMSADDFKDIVKPPAAV